MIAALGFRDFRPTDHCCPRAHTIRDAIVQRGEVILVCCVAHLKPGDTILVAPSSGPMTGGMA